MLPIRAFAKTNKQKKAPKRVSCLCYRVRPCRCHFPSWLVLLLCIWQLFKPSFATCPCLVAVVLPSSSFIPHSQERNTPFLLKQTWHTRKIPKQQQQQLNVMTHDGCNGSWSFLIWHGWIPVLPVSGGYANGDIEAFDEKKVFIVIHVPRLISWSIPD